MHPPTNVVVSSGPLSGGGAAALYGKLRQDQCCIYKGKTPRLDRAANRDYGQSQPFVGGDTAVPYRELACLLRVHTLNSVVFT